MMIGVVLVAHGAIAQAYFDVVESISGSQEAFKVLAISETDNMEDKRNDLMRIVDEVNQGRGVVVLTDLFGGTPSNLAISVLGLKPIEVIAGFNLPMILKLLTIRKKDDLSIAAQKAEEAGQKHIRIASEFLISNGAAMTSQRSEMAKAVGHDL